MDNFIIHKTLSCVAASELTSITSWLSTYILDCKATDSTCIQATQHYVRLNEMLQ